jgi:hypothetical protein
VRCRNPKCCSKKIPRYTVACSSISAIPLHAVASVLIPPKKHAKLFSIFNATYFLSWGIAGTFIAGPITDMLLAYGASEVFPYQMAFVSSAIMTLIGFL